MQRATLSLLPIITLLVIWSLVINPVFAATSTWIGGNGNWNDPANWSGGIVPQSRNDIAVFPNAPSPRTINLNSGAIEIGEVRFDSAMTYWLLGSGSLYFPPAGAGTIRTLRGNHIIGASIDLQKVIAFDTAADSSLIIASPNNLLRGSGGIIKTGEGELYLLTPNEHKGTTTISGGAIFVANDQAFGTSKLKLYSGRLIGAGGDRLIANQISDLNNDFTFDSGAYRLSFSTPFALPDNRAITVEGDVTFAGVTDATNSRDLRKNGSGNLTINLSTTNANIGSFVRNQSNGRLNLYGAGTVGAIVYNADSGGGEIGIGDRRDLATGNVIRGRGALNVAGNGDGIRLHGPNIRLHFEIGPGGDSLVLVNNTNNQNRNANIDLSGPGNPAGAELALSLVPGYTPIPGHTWIIIQHRSTGSIRGTFRDLPNGAVIELGGQPFQIVYEPKQVYLMSLPPIAMDIRGGNNQSALLNTDFAQPLRVWVGDENGNPFTGVYVSFTAPNSGASATFPAGNGGVSDLNGIVEIPVRANNVAGTYTVTATAGNVSINFTLTNVDPAPTATPEPTATATATPVPTATPTAPATATPVPTPGQAPQLELSLPASLAVGSNVQQQLNATGGNGNYTYQVSGQLPPGITLSADGRLEGRATQVGTYSFTITVTDSNGQTASFNYEIIVEPARVFVPIILKVAP
ncbi:putative Ig domain-containing protein [Chloroflexus sp.]|uniref:putative Ig domain-containing protein n=1 Tax=Chloroflexus sp. TaxID=1904827 RepID=UPI002ACE8D8D|nr:putative Ig domain-containing protein [Chloroflexus sp.]